MRALDKQRVFPVSVTCSQQEATQALKAALSNQPADVVLDCAGNAKTPDSLLACLSCLKPKGVMVLVGSLDVPLPLNTGEKKLASICNKSCQSTTTLISSMNHKGSSYVAAYTLHQRS